MQATKDRGWLTLVEPWNIEEKDELLRTPVFAVRERYCASPTSPAKAGRYFYLDCGDWVNVLAVTADMEVVLIEQFRHGSREITLEIPGGMVDPGEDALTAARREAVEESGYTSDSVELIGSVSPNPAIMNNRCHTALMRNATLTESQHLDGNEEIAVRLAPLAKIPELIRDGIIHHSLVVAAFFHYSLRTGTFS